MVTSCLIERSWYALKASVGRRSVRLASSITLLFQLSLSTSVTTKKDTTLEKVDVTIFDDTADAVLSFYGCMTSSPSHWTPSMTILLITNANIRADLGKPVLTLNHETLINVDPAITEAVRLRSYAKSFVKRESINPCFPENGITPRFFQLSTMCLT